MIDDEVDRSDGTAAALALVPLAGCLSAGLMSAPEFPSDMRVDTLYYEGDALTEGLWYRQEMLDDHRNEYQALIDDATAAEEATIPAETVRDFVVGTDFDESYLFVYQCGMPSALSLELTAIERTGSGIAVEITVNAPLSNEIGGIQEDWTVHSLLIRITDSRGAVPETVTVSVENDPYR